ncbi:uncharacterized protein M421DRAFT_352870 [Didymella exigua CBS 183.55]|uniref:Uncharacterized protein n=1 Tax=Didymella exigua CBS 183.55 TaxID=1150837 RepID=A0A6A5R6J2_9PLEO|nr:uncharacterized protein M421DRAFT_352870 [Didymella exigua CBS 183.55]KAF1922594.1 hypothetical protein M421DRAFT_352870 [Didymella exigua CBS 183.55]
MHLFWNAVAQGASHEALPSRNACSGLCSSPCDVVVVLSLAVLVRCQARITGSHGGQESGPRKRGESIALVTRERSAFLRYCCQ